MKLSKAVLTATAFAGALGVHAAHAIPGDNVVLRAMDKITARVSTITVPVGGTVAFGSLQITAKACDKHPPEETPEASAFLDVVEEKPGEAPQPRFQGWMFASSPALSALEHPVYDLWVLDCTGDDAGQPAPSSSSTTESGTSQ
ncbi:DUF2155 domain-containing protein [Dongia sp.]|uniref:DUF2155 domain-containing protein n=1 Tax=Dongia sp. TaxID=1977262 RepID=UPI0035B30AF1